MRCYTYDKGGEAVYQIGDKVVHPMHGAGVIDSIVQRKVAGQIQEYYLLRLSVGSKNILLEHYANAQISNKAFEEQRNLQWIVH